MSASQKFLLKLNIFLVSLSFFSLPALSQTPPQYPFLAEVIDHDINVRAGQSTGFEKLCQLNKGEEVVVLEQSFSWYKIRLPKRAAVYISEKYIERINDFQGKVTGSHVNIRASANADSSSLGMIAKDGMVKILGNKDGWYKIEPDEHAFGWIAGQYVSFKSNDVSLYHEPAFENIKEVSAVAEPKKESGMPENLFDVIGVLNRSTMLNSEGIYYQIVSEGKIKYYIKAAQSVLDRFIDQPVHVKGVQTDHVNNVSVPVLDLYQINLMY